MEKNIALIRGDGIGPEIVGQAVKVLDKVAEIYGHTFHYTDVDMGGNAIDKWGDPLPQEQLQKCLASDSVLLGAVGGPFANAARKLGMQVYGCDPFISIDAAWHLDSQIHRVNSREEVFSTCDIISLHTPLLDDTRKMINAETIATMKDGVIILNFARDLLVDDDAMAEALASGKVARYVTDFPNDKTASMPGCIAIPHLGASTEESEDNCAKMAVTEMMNYLENGNIINSVNFPNCDMGVCTAAGRICILHRNIPNSLSRFTTAVAAEGINIAGLMNKSRGEYAVTMLDLDHKVSSNACEHLKNIEGVLRVRVIQ